MRSILLRAVAMAQGTPNLDQLGPPGAPEPGDPRGGRSTFVSDEGGEKEVETRVGDEIWMYGVEHAVPHDASWYGRRLKGSAIHRYVQRLDGFVSVDARHDPGIVTTRRFVLRGSQLELNANVAIAHAGRRHQPRSSLPYEDPGNQSSLMVEVLGEDGELLARSQPLSGDGIALRPVWKGRTDLKELRARVVQLRFTLIYAKLFAFQLVDP